MSDSFAPPTGPPPPKVPEGWRAVWNDQYKEWFFVNMYTKQSQWDKPTEPIYPPGESAPDGPPPTYQAGDTKVQPDAKTGLSSNNPYASSAPHDTGASNALSEDERFARQLQAEEDARARQHQPPGQGAAGGYYNQPGAQPAYGYDQSNPSHGQYPPQGMPGSAVPTDEKGKSKGGFLGKLLGKAAAHQSKPHGGYYGGAPAGAYGHSQYGGHGGGFPMGGGHGGRLPMMGGGMMGGGHGGRKPGMGMAGAAALGVGGGLLGGALLADAIDDDQDYSQGYEQGAEDSGDFGGDGGGDFGGGDFGGGDF